MPKKPNAKTETLTPVPETEPSIPSPKSDSPSNLPKPTVVKSGPTKTPRKKLWWWIGGGAAAVLVAAGAGWMMMRQPVEQTTTNVSGSPNTNSQTLSPRVLDGVYVQADKTNPNLYAVMIENITESRPPSGIQEASLVYEALAEGGITRFMAIFPVGITAAEIGPVRSARLYYIQWAEDYKLLYVHVGGSPQAVEYVRTANVVDFNQFYNPRHFWRDKARRAPHNMYISSEKLYMGLKQVAPNLVPNYPGWKFKDEDTLAQRPSAQPDIVIDYSSFSYRVTYKYNREQNVYARYQGDTEHVTKEGAKLAPKNVVVLFLKTGLIPGDRQRLQMDVVGEGRLLLFRDGQKFEGTWKKAGARERLQLFDGQGQPMMLDRGMTWISAVPTDRKVTF